MTPDPVWSEHLKGALNRCFATGAAGAAPLHPPRVGSALPGPTRRGVPRTPDHRRRLTG
jgi:hypothetical protein